MTTRTITAIYDSESDANQARQRLVQTGLAEDDVRIVSQSLTRSDVSSDTGDDDRSMWESIKDFFVGDDDDRYMYSEGVRRGGYLLTARVDDRYGDEAITQLEQTNAIDLDARAEQWRSEGWTGASVQNSDMASLDATSVTSDTARVGIRAGARGSDQEQAIPIVREQLRVGKREVDRGSVRVRSYIVEEPVHEDVTLREERVEVERRPVADRQLNAADATLLRDQTIEVSERGEEAVVAKDAVVTEEVVVRKTADERVESVDETLRHTEVDVDDTTRGDGTDRGGTTKTRSGSSNKRKR
jgi:uncharacterized protein (TIGR02271 family)